MKKLLLFLCLLVHIGFAETPRIDSLKRELGRLDKQPNGYTKDTLRFKTLKAIMRGYADVYIDSSIHYNNLLIKLCRDKKLQKELVYAYYYTGLIYQIQGKHYQSIQSYYKTLSIAEKLKQYAQMALLYGGLAHAYSSLNKNAKALTLCQQGLAVLRKHPDSNAYYEQLLLLNAEGVIYRQQGKFTDALQANQAMYKLARTKPYAPWYECHGLHAIGLVYKEMGNMTKAITYHKKALILSPKASSVVLEGNILVNIADIYIRQERWQQALSYCSKAKEMALRAKNSSILSETDEKLYTIYKNMGKPQEALKAYEDFIRLKDSLAKETNQQRIEALQAQYDNVQKTNSLQQRVQLLAQENKNQELAQTRNVLLLGIVAILLVAALLFWNNRRLQAKNWELNRKNEEIKGALFKGQTIERKRVALELHDNLSSLLSAVNMSIQAINPQNLSASEQSVYNNVKHLIQSAYAEVRNISHNILPAGLEREGLAITLATLVDRLNQSSPLQFSLTIRGLEERLPVEIEFNIYSIVFELINNAMRHAKANSVSIGLLRTNSGINISVTDDGIGLGQSHDKRGIGLQNIRTRLDSLGGTFNTMLPAEKGTRIDINIPIETMYINGNISAI